MTEKAEGNPLFAEEIVSFLTERGVLRATAGRSGIRRKRGGDSAAGERAEPADRARRSARAKRPRASAGGFGDRKALRSAIAGRRGRRDATSTPGSPRCRALDLVHPESKSSDYAFKHALVRDALYQSLLTRSASALHLKIAEEIERRSGNRLIEVAETLAHHYSQTDRADKAFTYLAMAGSRSLSVYSLDEAEAHFSAAIALVEANPECASDQQIANALVDCTMLQMQLGKVTKS